MSFARRVPFVLVPLFAASLFAQEPTAQKHVLRMTPKAGTEGHYVHSTEMNTETKIAETAMTMGISAKVYFTATTKAVDGGKATVEQKHTRVAVRSNNPMSKVDYDSAKPDSRPGEWAQLADLIGETVSMTFSDRGKVMEAKPSPDFPASATKNAGIVLEQALEQCVPEFPEQGIAIGESWTTSMNMPMPGMGEMRCSIVNKLVEIGDGKAKLEQEFQYDTTKLQLPGGAKFEARKSTGYTILDLATCLPIDSQSTMMLDVIVQSAGGGVTMLMSATTKLARVEPTKEAAEAKSAEGAKDGEQKGK